MKLNYDKEKKKLKHKLKTAFLFCFLSVSITIHSQTDSLPFITINFNAGHSFYTRHYEGIPDTHLSGPSFNPSLSIDIGFRLNERTQLFIGGHLYGRSYRIINSHPQKYGFVSKNRSTTIWNTPLTLSFMLYNEKNTKFFYLTSLGYSKVINDVRYVYNDSIVPNYYAIRNRQSGNEEGSVMVSLGFAAEHRLFIKEIYAMCQVKYIVESSFGSATSINRLCLSAGLSFKVY